MVPLHRPTVFRLLPGLVPVTVPGAVGSATSLLSPKLAGVGGSRDHVPCLMASSRTAELRVIQMFINNARIAKGRYTARNVVLILSIKALP